MRKPVTNSFKQHIQSLSGSIEAVGVKLGLAERPAEIARLLDLWWPDAYKSEYTGKAIMSPADSADLEALFELFGVPMRVADNQYEIVKYAYGMFATALSHWVDRKLYHPEHYPNAGDMARSYGWSEDWGAYIEAVAAGDRAQARRLAIKLQPLSPDCEFPETMLIKAGNHTSWL